MVSENMPLFRVDVSIFKMNHPRKAFEYVSAKRQNPSKKILHRFRFSGEAKIYPFSRNLFA